MRELHVVVPYKRIWLGPNLEKKIGVNRSGYRIKMGNAALSTAPLGQRWISAGFSDSTWLMLTLANENNTHCIRRERPEY